MINNNVTRRIIILLSFLMLSTPVWGQRGQKGQPGPSRPEISQIVDELSKELSLSKSQERQVTSLFKAHFEEMDQLMSQKQKAQRMDREVMNGHRRDFEAQVKAILTPDQIKAFDEFQKSHDPEKQDKRPRR